MDVKLPNLGEGADTGTVVNVFVKEGDKIEKDQPLLELENEKAVATIPSTASGVVAKIHVKSGDKIGVGQRIVSIGGGGSDAAPAAKPVGEPARAPKARPAPQPVEDQPETEHEETAEESSLSVSRMELWRPRHQFAEWRMISASIWAEFAAAAAEEGLN